MPFVIRPFFRKPFKLFAIDADTNKPIDPNVRRKTRVTYYEIQNGSNGSKKLVAHKSASQASDKKAENGKDKPAGKDEAKEDVKSQLKGDDVAWTTEEDEKLKAMKAEGKTWAMIVEEMGRVKHSITTRWKEIDPSKNNNQADKQNDGGKNDGAGGNDKGDQPKQNQGGNNNNNGQGQGKKGKKGNNKNNRNKQEDQPKQKTDQKPTEKKPSSDTKNGETRFTTADWLTLQEDDVFSFGELQCLSELIGKDSDQSWQRIAAKFFDLTGRRVHPGDVSEKFERMAAVAVADE